MYSAMAGVERVARKKTALAMAAQIRYCTRPTAPTPNNFPNNRRKELVEDSMISTIRDDFSSITPLIIDVP